MKLTKLLLLSIVFSGSLAAQDLKIIGTVTQRIKVPVSSVSKKKYPMAATTIKTRDIALLKIQLSDKAKLNFANKAKNAIAQTQQFTANTSSPDGTNHPEKVELGMNNVPVLDQGKHGSCVTFAVTAAFDAALDQGDYISQLCQLQLGRYLEQNAYAQSGWDGSFARMALVQIDTFGFVNKEQQTTYGCGGVREYPYDSPVPDTAMTPEEFHQVSEDTNVFWSTQLDIFQTVSDRIDTTKTINDVKATLNVGDRMTIGVLLWDVDLGLAGAVGSNKATSDSWVLTPEIARDVYLRPDSVGGHEMVITGYDDNAVAIDDHGREHRGLLTLRNSWGTKLGNQGDFYMSYDYFKMFVIEIQRIRASI